MSSPRQQRIFAFWLSVLIHALIVVALTFSIPLSFQKPSAGPLVVPIETVMIDERAYEAEIASNEAERQAENQRIERERVAAERAEQRQRDEDARVERERVAAEREKIRIQQEAAAEAERLARAEQERIQREAAAAEAARQEALAAQRAADLRREQQTAAAAEIARSVAAEQEARAARDSPEMAQWIAAISNDIQQSWIEPPNTSPDLECLVDVTQQPGGVVVAVTVVSCTTGAADNVVRSIENAVRNASPLPRPPNAALFDPRLRIKFTP